MPWRYSLHLSSFLFLGEIFQSPIEAFEDRHKVFRMLLKEGLIAEERVQMILSWRHTGFHIHNEGKVVASPEQSRRILKAGSVLQDTLSDPLYPWNDSI